METTANLTQQVDLSDTNEVKQDAHATLEKISKNKLRKLRNYQRLVQNRSVRRERERNARKEKRQRRRPHTEEKIKTTEKLLKALENGPEVVIDCQYNERMSPKEQRRLAQQLRRVYASNKIANEPLHLYFTSLDESSEFFKTCSKLNDGFSKYIVQRSEQSFLEIFPTPRLEQLIYLSPDAPTALETLDPTKIYVIGGLVDETIQINITKSFTESKSIVSARLPILEHFEPSQGTSKLVLAVNQVVDIILKWYETKDWVQAIQVGLPNRTGFVPRQHLQIQSLVENHEKIDEYCDKQSSDI